MEPFVTYDERTDTWTLERDFVVQSRGYTLTVPGGFKSDLASIPRALWAIIPSYQLGLSGPLVHDWLYRHGGKIAGADKPFSRADADAFLLDLMEQSGVSTWRRWSAYHGVRLFGGSSWQPLASTT